jgi:hypothetical protein
VVFLKFIFLFHDIFKHYCFFYLFIK